MKNHTRFNTVLALLLSLVFIGSSKSSQKTTQNPPADDSQAHSQNGNVVYVCACLKTKSCSCMTEAKMEGPCACGTAGGPPMKAVAPDSKWAKQNREALAK